MLPVAGPPIRDGAVLLDAEGRILAVGPADAVPAPEHVPSHDLPDRVLLPGLVNVHTHLELTGFEHAVPEDDFAAWIRHLRARKEARAPEAWLAATERGLRACWAAGVTTIADTGDSGAPVTALARLGGSGVCYHEVFGPDPALSGESLAGLQARVADLAGHAGGRVRFGVSPHAPYTVSGPLYRAVARWARQERLPIAVHLAESHAETGFVSAGTGAFADAWRSRGLVLPGAAAHRAGDGATRSPVSWVDAFDVLGPDTLVIHGVQVSADDIATLAARGAALAHCPRANRRHGHGDAPVRAYQAAGVRVGLGTDSAASVAPPDLWAEARLAAELAGLDAAGTLALLTRDGAAALGLAGAVGVLAPGAWGDLLVMSGGGETGDEVALAAVAAGADGVRATLVGGRVVSGRLP